MDRPGDDNLEKWNYVQYKLNSLPPPTHQESLQNKPKLNYNETIREQQEFNQILLKAWENKSFQVVPKS